MNVPTNFFLNFFGGLSIVVIVLFSIYSINIFYMQMLDQDNSPLMRTVSFLLLFGSMVLPFWAFNLYLDMKRMQHAMNVELPNTVNRLLTHMSMMSSIPNTKSGLSGFDSDSIKEKRNE